MNKRVHRRQADEAREHCKACQVDVKEKRVDLANTKSEIITQLREMVSQCDLTLKAVSPASTPKAKKTQESARSANTLLSLAQRRSFAGDGQLVPAAAGPGGVAARQPPEPV